MAFVLPFAKENRAKTRPITSRTTLTADLYIPWSEQRLTGRHSEDAGRAETCSAEQRYRPEQEKQEVAMLMLASVDKPESPPAPILNDDELSGLVDACRGKKFADAATGR
jgi:hypothetical protein